MPEPLALLEATVAAAPIGVAIIDGDLRYRYINEHLAALNGVTIADTLGRTLEEVVGELAAVIAPRLRTVMETGQPVTVRSSGVLPAATGTLRHLESHNRVLRDATGAVVGVAAYVIDITAQVAAQAELEQAQSIAQFGSWEANMVTGEVVWSRELRRMYGMDADCPASYESWIKLVHPDDRARVAELVGRSVASGEAVDYEYRLVRPSGEVRIIAGRNRALGVPAGRPERLLGTSQDVTEQRAMELRLQVVDRLASLGTLAAGLAHEINNPLAYTLGNVDLAMEGLAALAQTGGLGSHALERIAALRELLADAAQGGSRVRTIVRDMKVFARGDSQPDGEIDLRPVVESAVTLASNEIRQRARLRVAYGPTPQVKASAPRLGQVVLNLLLNATQAIPEGRPDDHEIHVGTFTDEKGRAVVEVGDTGTGIPAEQLGRIFDPFFTTKAVGNGSGLGLSICHGIVHSLGGEITVDSTPGHGARFRVIVPAGGPPPAVLEARPEPPPVARRVLVIDDEPQVVAFCKRSLAGRCEVVALTDSREAQARLADGEDFDLILCDAMMPRLSGIDLYEQVIAERPELAGRFVFMSGGAFTRRAQEFMEAEERVRLDKPFTPGQLRALVDERLRPPAAAAVARSPDPPTPVPRAAK